MKQVHHETKSCFSKPGLPVLQAGGFEISRTVATWSVCSAEESFPAMWGRGVGDSYGCRCPRTLSTCTPAPAWLAALPAARVGGSVSEAFQSPPRAWLLKAALLCAVQPTLESRGEIHIM